jgi:hypothetical protein
VPKPYLSSITLPDLPIKNRDEGNSDSNDSLKKELLAQSELIKTDYSDMFARLRSMEDSLFPDTSIQIDRIFEERIKRAEKEACHEKLF